MKRTSSVGIEKEEREKHLFKLKLMEVAAQKIICERHQRHNLKIDSVKKTVDMHNQDYLDKNIFVDVKIEKRLENLKH